MTQKKPGAAAAAAAAAGIMMGGWMYLLLLLFVCFGHSHAFNVPVSHRRTYVSSALGSMVQNTSPLTDKNFESDDPSEQCLMELVKKQHLCGIAKIASSSRLKLRALRSQYPLRANWANDMIHEWRNHPDARVTAKNSQDILDTIIREDVIVPNASTFGLVVSSWISHTIDKGNIKSMERAAALLEQMKILHSQNKKYPRPDRKIYQKLVMGWIWCAVSLPRHAAMSYKAVLDLLQEMRIIGMRPTEDLQKRFYYRVRDRRPLSHLAVLEKIVRELETPYKDEASSGQKEFSAMMRNILVSMNLETRSLTTSEVEERVYVLLQEWYDIGADEEFRPSKSSLARMMNNNGNDAFVRNRALLTAMRGLYEKTGDDTIKPDKTVYNTLLKTLVVGNLNIKSADTNAIKTLREMWNRYYDGDDEIKPDTNSYNMVMKALSLTGGSKAAVTGEELLKEMKHRYAVDRINEDLMPDSVTYCSLISMWSKDENHFAGLKGAKMLREMWHWNKRGRENIRPKRLQYNQVLQAIARCGGAGAEADAHAVFRDQWERYEQTGDPSIKPNQSIYTNMMRVLTDNANIENAGKKAVALLRDMWEKYDAGDEALKPDEENYNQVLQVLSTDNAREAGELAEEILQQMWGLYEKDPSPHPVSKRTLKPNNFKYFCLIKAWASSGHENAGERAEALLRDMWRRFQAGDRELRPRNVHYANAIKATRSGQDPNESINRAMALLDELWKVYERLGTDALRPERSTYSMVLSVLTSSHTEDAADRAIALFRDMEARYKPGKNDLRPTLLLYSQVLLVFHANPTERSGLQAEGLLREMWDIYNKERILRPTTTTYSGVIQALFRSKDEYGYENGRRVLREMWERYGRGDNTLKPIGDLYNQIIGAVGRDSGRKGFVRAKELLMEMFDFYHNGDRTLKPNKYTYATMLNIMYGIYSDKEAAEEAMRDLWSSFKGSESDRY